LFWKIVQAGVHEQLCQKRLRKEIFETLSDNGRKWVGHTALLASFRLTIYIVYCIFCTNRNTENNEMTLTVVEQRFILHWGEMGTRWGINRTVAQVHALLFLSAKPLHAEEISETLSVARSNVSTSLRELQGWGIVRVVHVLGERKDHFESVKDVCEIFKIVAEERKRREIDPTLRVLQECVAEMKKPGTGSAHTRERLEEMLEFLTTASGLFEEVLRIPPGILKGTMRLRRKLPSLFTRKEDFSQ
jgi:DNA-binding transcriptional regulator GbsR (MarR family)